MGVHALFIRCLKPLLRSKDMMSRSLVLLGVAALGQLSALSAQQMRREDTKTVGIEVKEQGTQKKVKKSTRPAAMASAIEQYVAENNQSYNSQRAEADMVYCFCYSPSGAPLPDHKIIVTPPSLKTLMDCQDGPFKSLVGVARQNLANQLRKRFVAEA